MDKWLRIGDKVNMQMARTALTILMMLIVLPWGAYAGSAMTASKPNSHQFENAPGQIRNLSQKESLVWQQTLTNISVGEKCLAMSLLGSACGPDHVLSMAPELSLKRYLPTLSSIYSVWHFSGREVAPPRSPPRLF